MTGSGNIKSIRLKSWLQFTISVALIILVASVSSIFRIRVDLTEDKRYTLSVPTRKVLSDLRNDIYIQVYLDGEMPIPLKRLKRSVREMLDEFRVVSRRKIDYEFVNPSTGYDPKQRDRQYGDLMKKGLIPVDLRASDAEGGSSVKRIFPGMLVNYNGIEVPVNFLNNSTPSYEQNILRSVEGLEYEMIQTIATVSSDTIYRVAFLEGHGEIPEIETADITYNIARFFTVDRGVISGKSGVLDKYAAVVIAGPEKEFSEADKLVLDQYIMKGGKVMWLFDEVAVNTDSLAYGETMAIYRPLNIEDQLFRYGARVNPAIIQDLDCSIIRLKVTVGGTNSQFEPAPWVYYPKLHPAQNHPITRNINKVKGEFVNYIDTVGLNRAIKKVILLTSSSLSRILSPPAVISLREAELIPDKKDYNKPDLPVAVLLEGVFPSAFKNRMISSITDDKNLKIKTESIRTKMIVIADADVIRNEVRRAGLQEQPLPLGQDKYTGEIFGNRDFLINCLNYLVDDNGLMELRSRELKLRLLNSSKIKSEKIKWQILNISCPVLLVIIAGFIYGYFRKRKYAGHISPGVNV
jgi:ABC-2 type transport system permease protein